jgi:hypothetical protein
MVIFMLLRCDVDEVETRVAIGQLSGMYTTNQSTMLCTVWKCTRNMRSRLFCVYVLLFCVRRYCALPAHPVPCLPCLALPALLFLTAFYR